MAKHLVTGVALASILVVRFAAVRRSFVQDIWQYFCGKTDDMPESMARGRQLLSVSAQKRPLDALLVGGPEARSCTCNVRGIHNVLSIPGKDFSDVISISDSSLKEYTREMDAVEKSRKVGRLCSCIYALSHMRALRRAVSTRAASSVRSCRHQRALNLLIRLTFSSSTSCRHTSLPAPPHGQPPQAGWSVLACGSRSSIETWASGCTLGSLLRRLLRRPGTMASLAPSRSPSPHRRSRAPNNPKVGQSFWFQRDTML
jgi:hypothetical protein